MPAGAILFIRVPVLTVLDVKGGRQLLAVQVRAGDSLVVSYRHSVTQGLVSGTFEVEGDDTLSVTETTFGSPGPGLPEPRPGDAYEIAGGVIRHFGRGERLPSVSFFVHPFTEHTLVLKGKTVNLSRDLPPGSLVKIRMERRFWWWAWRQKLGALLSRMR